jgi:hypothetical protein
MRAVLVHPTKFGLFGLLSLADLFLTWQLLQNSEGLFYESNPVARWFLVRYSWAGLAAFKGLTVLLAGGLLMVTSRYRPGLGGRGLTVACSALAAVVLYSCWLCQGASGREDAAVIDLRRLEQEKRQLDETMRVARRYRALRDEMSADLIARRRTLAEAVEQLAGAEQAEDLDWLRRRFPDRSLRECVAVNVAEWAVERLKDNPTDARRLSGELADAYQALFGCSFPPRGTWSEGVGAKKRPASLWERPASVGEGPCPPLVAVASWPSV